MTIQIHNTLTRRKEPFEPLAPPKVSMYNCGPTVYGHFHIGNARNFVVVDTIRRHLEYRGYQVRLVQNLTDIDDKIIRRARDMGLSPGEVAQKYTAAYFHNADRLGVRRADVHPRATESIGPMIEMINRILERDMAYVAEGNVYFRVSRAEGYGQLSGNKLEDIREGARVEVDERKEHPADFDLWKAAKPGEPAWDSPWGRGRPGWHLECSTMARACLGETIDIHSGGADLVFPHHENEMAQSQCANGKPLARYWIHNGFLTIRNEQGQEEKMSKSLGNDLRIDRVLERFDAMAVRVFLLSAHYRSPLAYSDGALEEAGAALERLRGGLDTARKLLSIGAAPRPEAHRDPAAREQAAAIRREFLESMDDDFNTPRALAALFRAVNEIHEIRQRERDSASLSQEAIDALASLAETTEELMALLGLAGAPEERASPADSLLEPLIGLLISVRAAARKAKAFELADAVRAGLDKLGIALEDHPQGTIWKRK